MRFRLSFRQLPKIVATGGDESMGNRTLNSQVIEKYEQYENLCCNAAKIVSDFDHKVSSVAGWDEPPSQPSGVQRGEPGSRKTCARLFNFKRTAIPRDSLSPIRERRRSVRTDGPATEAGNHGYPE
jgi:hypothetical protein